MLFIKSSQYIVSLNKYLESGKNNFFVGIRFRMRFEGEDSPDGRFTGTIVGVGDISTQWPDSRWRSLKIQWDEHASFHRPDRVSPLEIEPFVASASTSLIHAQPAAKTKRARAIDIPTSKISSNLAASCFWYHGSTRCIPSDMSYL